MRNMEKYRDEIENYVNCSHLARRDRDFGSIILMFRDEIEITYCYSDVSRRERETQIEFLKVEWEKSRSILTRSRENEILLIRRLRESKLGSETILQIQKYKKQEYKKYKNTKLKFKVTDGVATTLFFWIVTILLFC